MAKKFIAYEENGYDDVNRRPTYKVVRKFKHDVDAIAFVDDDKNIRMHPGLRLETTCNDGKKYEWNTATQGWEECL